MSVSRSTHLPVIPMGKPRMTKRDRWKKRPVVERYHDFCDALRAHAQRAGFTPSPDGMVITFHLPMPPSWPKKRRAAMDGQPHQQKPDIDNLTKAFLDALMGEDCAVWRITAEKRWAQSGGITVVLEQREAA